MGQKIASDFPAIQTSLFLATGAAGGTGGEELYARTAEVNLDMNFIAAQWAVALH